MIRDGETVRSREHDDRWYEVMATSPDSEWIVLRLIGPMYRRGWGWLTETRHILREEFDEEFIRFDLNEIGYAVRGLTRADCRRAVWALIAARGMEAHYPSKLALARPQ